MVPTILTSTGKNLYIEYKSTNTNDMFKATWKQMTSIRKRIKDILIQFFISQLFAAAPSQFLPKLKVLLMTGQEIRFWELLPTLQEMISMGEESTEEIQMLTMQSKLCLMVGNICIYVNFSRLVFRL